MSKRNVETRFTSSVMKDGPGDRKAAIFTYKELSSMQQIILEPNLSLEAVDSVLYIESTGQVIKIHLAQNIFYFVPPFSYKQAFFHLFSHLLPNLTYRVLSYVNQWTGSLLFLNTSNMVVAGCSC